MSETICRCCTCTVAECTCAGGRDPDKRIDCDGEHTCAQSGCSRYDRPKPDLLPKAETLPTDCYDFGADADTNRALVQCAQAFLISRAQQCMAAKQAHDLTANHYRGSWGKWCEAVGISRDTGDAAVRVAEAFGNIELNGKPLIEALPITLLYAAAKPSAPPELVARVKKGEIATHKEYQAAMKQKDDKIARLERANRDKDKLLEAGEKNQEMFRRRSEQYAEACADRDRWKARAEELEARPVEVAVEIDEAEVERRAQEKAQALAAEMVRSAPAPDDPEQAEHDAYDAGLQFWRTIDNAWRLARPRASTLRPELKRAIYERCAEIFEKVRKDMTS